MIGSTLSTIAAAEKLSVAQLQQAVKNGTIPAYIGVPMIEQKIKMEKEAQQPMNAEPQPSVADRVMAEASAKEAGVDQLQSNLPSGYARGGIVAFAEGGDVDEDYEEALEASKNIDMMNSMIDEASINSTPRVGISALPRASAQAFTAAPAIAAAPSMSYSDVQGARMKADKAPGKIGGTGHKYESFALEEAKRQGVDPKLVLHVLNKETGNLKNPESAKSSAGALGVMQLMPATAKMLGVKDPLNPEENIRGGIKYLAQLSKQFDEPRLIAAAYNAGPGNVRKYGTVPPFKETQGYVQGLASGGIASFSGTDPEYGSYVQDEEDDRSRMDMIKDFFGKRDPNSWAAGTGKRLDEKMQSGGPFAEGSTISNYLYGKPNRGQGTLRGLTDKQLAQATAEGNENAAYNWPSQSIGQANGYATAAEALAARDGKPSPASPAAPASDTTSQTETPLRSPFSDDKTKELSPLEKLIQDVNESRAERKANADKDKYLSLMAAGLGMLGSQSQYANVGIGQGALQGLSLYSNLSKQRAAEDAADTKSAILAQQYKQAGDLARERLAQGKQLKEQEVAGERLRALDTSILANAKAKFGDPDLLTAEKRKAYNDYIENAKRNDPQYKLWNDILFKYQIDDVAPQMRVVGRSYPKG